jgi:hypothetical protein
MNISRRTARAQSEKRKRWQKMRFNIILFLDAIINLVLGILLLPASDVIADLLGVPGVGHGFYASILGAVLFGIGIALLFETFKGEHFWTGLGLYGAVAINLCGGIVLAIWLLFAQLALPLRGQIFLWILVFILIIISTIEMVIERHSRKGSA